MNRMGERPPIPIRDPVREAAATRPSEVKTYTLPPEEIERIFGKAKRPEGKPPMQLTTEWKHQPKEDDEMNMTKREYLAERLAGKTRTQICKERAKNAPSFYAQLAKWSIKDKADEDAVLEELRAKQEPKQPDPEPKQEPPRLEQGGDVSKPEPAEEAKLTGATITGASTYPRLELSRDALTLRIAPAIEWFTPATVRTSEPTISVSRYGFTIDGPTSKRYGLSPGDRVRIGVAGQQLVIATDPAGLRLRRSGTAGCKLSSESLARWPRWQAIVKRRYAVRMEDGMIVAEVEVAAE